MPATGAMATCEDSGIFDQRLARLHNVPGRLGFDLPLAREHSGTQRISGRSIDSNVGTAAEETGACGEVLD